MTATIPVPPAMIERGGSECRDGVAAMASGDRASSHGIDAAAPELDPGDPPVTLPTSTRKQIDGENFPVALRILPPWMRRGLLALYGYARYVDDIGDEFAGPRLAALHEIARQVMLLYRGERVEIPAVAGLAVLREQFGVPAEPFLDLIEANVADQRVTRYPRFADLVDYCRLSANPVGRVVLAIAGAREEHLGELSDRICTGLQIIEHIQDIGEDYRAGRIYLPQQDMARFGVPEDALGDPSARDRLRDLLRYETDRAVAYLDAGAPLVSALRGPARVAVAGFLAGGRAAAGTVRAAGYDVLSRDCSPPRRAILSAFLRATVQTPG